MANPNPQREAIYCLINGVPAQNIDWDPRDADLLLPSGRRLYFWGISDGDFVRPGDTPVIVLGLDRYEGEWSGIHLLPICTHIVLQCSRRKYGIFEQVVGRLEVEFSRSGIVVFRPAGKPRTFVYV